MFYRPFDCNAIEVTDERVSEICSKFPSGEPIVRHIFITSRNFEFTETFMKKPGNLCVIVIYLLLLLRPCIIVIEKRSFFAIIVKHFPEKRACQGFSLFCVTLPIRQVCIYRRGVFT